MLLTVNEDSGHCVIAVSGEIDLSTSGELDSAVVAALQNETEHLTLDFSEVSFLDSSGLGVVVKALKRAKEANTLFDLVSANERVLKVFSLTGLDTLISIYATLDAVAAQ